MDKTQNKSLFFDLIIVALSIFIAIVFIKTGFLTNILTSTKELEYLGSFIAGIFFTSIFTTAPAIVTLGQIAASNSLLLTALFGGLGAVIGDLIIFKFVRDSISEHIAETINNQVITKSLKSLFKDKLFRWATFFVSGLILASPLPDELGASLLGFLKIKTKWFILLSFIFNSVGILLIGMIASSL